MLPDSCYGEWELLGSSGGITGSGDPGQEATRSRLVVSRDNTMVWHSADGEILTRRFAVRRGRSIFSSADRWLVVFEDGSAECVVEVGTDGRLLLSENVYDGFSFSYRAVGD